MRFGPHLFDKEATLERLFAPIKKPTDDSLLGAMKKVTDERTMIIDALRHISKTSNSYESRYAKKILTELGLDNYYDGK